VSDSKEQIHGTITARAELDRAFARLIIEDVTGVMSKNLITILDMMEKHNADLRSMLEDYSERLRKVEARITRIEHVLAERPAAREKEHRAILDAIGQVHVDGNADHDGP